MIIDERETNFRDHPRGCCSKATISRPGGSRFRACEGKIRANMPEVSRFFGVVIRVYFRDHSPAHFHAGYGEHEGAD
jgi:hypothetical protein